MKLQQLEDRLGHCFQNQDLLREALTHSTFAYEHRADNLANNERLEFLGDAVLDLVISSALFELPEHYSEGFMTKTRALVVCESSLMMLAQNLGLGQLLILGKGEAATGGREKPSNLANAVEALFGAIYLDAGFSKARQVILNLLGKPLQRALSGSICYDYKSRLLELIQGTRPGSTFQFSIIKEEGPVHERLFTAAVILDGDQIASGSGGSKKEAEQQAAKAALGRLDPDSI